MALALLVGGCASMIYQPHADTAPQMTRQQAEDVLKRASENFMQVPGIRERRGISNIEEDGFDLVLGPPVSTLVGTADDLPELWRCYYREMNDMGVYASGKLFSVLPTGRIAVAAPCPAMYFSTQKAATEVADAIYQLRNKTFSESGVAGQTSFSEIARRYREATVKPAVPEAARKHMQEAQSAYRQKRFKEAATASAAAVQLVPWWPEGRFNHAVILRATQEYEGAIAEMNRYLELVPAASNVEAARKQIRQWEAEREALTSDYW
ncbi:MAG: hypothetical protein L0Y32_04045 [Nevskiales bacterium]|nr:hypothetical protein [Nevskiales bacterium]